MGYLLEHDKKDFRDLLPVLDRAVFKHPFIPAKIWKSLGSSFDLKQWGRVLKKHRISVTLGAEGFTVVAAGFYDETNLIIVEISSPKLFKIDALKFELIQTVMHELIHANQFSGHADQYERPFGKSKDEEQAYLGMFGEIQAFSHCIALEFMQFGWGAGPTITRYDNAEYQVKRELLRQLARWVEKHENHNH